MRNPSTPTVAVVIPCYRQGRFLADAIDSAVNQSVPAQDIIVVDDGGEEDLSAIVAGFPSVRMMRQANRGLAGARNFGLRETACDKVIFLDADDRLLPEAIRAGLDCYVENPQAAFVYGAFEEVTRKGRKRSYNRARSRTDLVRFNWVGMIGSAMFDRKRLLEEGGFDESLGMCEDWDAFLRLARRSPFAAHELLVARYIKHDGNMSNDVRKLKQWIGIVRARERQLGLTTEEEQAWQEGAALWDAAYPENTPVQLAKRLVRKTRRSLESGHHRAARPVHSG